MWEALYYFENPERIVREDRHQLSLMLDDKNFKRQVTGN